MSQPLDFGNLLVVTPSLQGPPGVPGGAGDYVIVTPSLSPFQLAASSPWVFVDARTGAVQLLLPSVVNSAGAYFAIVNGYAAANVITLVPPAGVTCWDPSTVGTYRTPSPPLATLASADGKPYRFKYSTTLSAWVPW